MLALIRKASQQLEPGPPTVLSLRCREITPPDLDRLTVYRDARKYWVGVINHLTQHQPPAGCPEYGNMQENDGAPVGVLLVASMPMFAYQYPRRGDEILPRLNRCYHPLCHRLIQLGFHYKAVEALKRTVSEANRALLQWWERAADATKVANVTAWKVR